MSAGNEMSTFARIHATCAATGVFMLGAIVIIQKIQELENQAKGLLDGSRFGRYLRHGCIAIMGFGGGTVVGIGADYVYTNIVTVCWK